jgi:hypothetical protein
MSQILEQIHHDIQQDNYYLENFSNEGERFLAWYLRNVYLRTKIQARDDITDGAGDKGIDAIIVDDEQRRVIIIQGKFYAGGVDHQPLQEILGAWMQIQDLAALQENTNPKLKVKLAAVSEALQQDDYEVVFELVTTGILTNSASVDLVVFSDAIAEYEHPVVSLTLVDESALAARWEEALDKNLPELSHTLTLESGRFLAMDVAGYKTVFAALPLADCLQLPGIGNGLLFRKNVRQSLGLTNKVNKGLKQTITGENPQYFMLYHNGITALCRKMSLDPQSNQLRVDGLSVVNGCQSLTTILACSEKVKSAQGAYILFRFYEIPQTDVADKISVNTNSQSAVKPRDLRANDKHVTALKRAYENMYPDGYLLVKRGEERPADRDAQKTIDIVQLAKCLMTWHAQRPNIAYNENKLFDKYFDLLFRQDYSPEDVLALNIWFQRIEKRWAAGDLDLDQALLAAPSYSKFHLLFAVQACFCAASNQNDKVPVPAATNKPFADPNAVINVAATCYNSALGIAISEYQDKGKIFSPQNWLKAKDSIVKIQTAVKMYLGMAANLPGGVELKKTLTIPADKFTLRWSAE